MPLRPLDWFVFSEGRGRGNITNSGQQQRCLVQYLVELKRRLYATLIWRLLLCLLDLSQGLSFLQTRCVGRSTNVGLTEGHPQGLEVNPDFGKLDMPHNMCRFGLSTAWSWMLY